MTYSPRSIYSALRLILHENEAFLRISWAPLGLIHASSESEAIKLAREKWRFVPPGLLAVELLRPVKH